MTYLEIENKMLKHYVELIESIGFYQLLNLPELYKDELKNTTSISHKIRILEYLIEKQIVR